MFSVWIIDQTRHSNYRIETISSLSEKNVCLLCFVIFEEVDEHESTEKVCKSDYGVGRRMPFEVNLKSPLKSSFTNNISVTDRSGLATNKPHGDLAVDLLNNIVIMGISVSHQICLYLVTLSVQFSSVAQSCLTLCDTMDYSTPGLPVHQQLPEFTQTCVH